MPTLTRTTSELWLTKDLRSYYLCCTCPVGSGNKLNCGGAADADADGEWIVIGVDGDATGSGMSAVVQLPKTLGSGVYQ